MAKFIFLVVIVVRKKQESIPTGTYVDKRKTQREFS
jgi:hypothetical protein